MFRLKKKPGVAEVSARSGAENFSEMRKAALMAALFLILFALAAVTIVMGAYNISIQEAYTILITHLAGGDVSSLNKLHNTIVWNIRLPRILLAITVGIALAASGAVYQGCFRNPLVEPYILGVSAGAAFGAALGIVYPHIFLSVQFSAFLFASLAVFLAYMLARNRGETPVVTLILAGVIMGSIFTACVSIMKPAQGDHVLDDGRLLLRHMERHSHHTRDTRRFLHSVVL